jgi:ComF family protein
VSFRATCNAILAAIVGPPCAVCGRVLDAPLDGAVCGSCWTAITPRRSSFVLQVIAQGRAIGPYESTLREVIHALKYDKRRSIAPRLAAMMASEGLDVLRGADLVVPVPLHRRRQRERGFNQAEELARHLPVPMRRVLKRVRATRPQIELPAHERRDNVRDAFALRRPLLGLLTRRAQQDGRPLQGRTIVVVDDVATTGATLDACARVLQAAGAVEVRALTAARVVNAR